MLTCIRRRCTIRQAGRSLFTNAERHLKPPEEMLRLFRAFPRAVKRTLMIAERALGFSLDMIAALVEGYQSRSREPASGIRAGFPLMSHR